MSKKAKKATAARRLTKKMAMKAANKALYLSRRRSGENTKSNRFIISRKKKGLERIQRHIISICGNIGCEKCDPCKIFKRGFGRIPVKKIK